MRTHAIFEVKPASFADPTDITHPVLGQRALAHTIARVAAIGGDAGIADTEEFKAGLEFDVRWVIPTPGGPR